MAQKKQISHWGRMVDVPEYGNSPAMTAAEAFASQGTPLGPPIPDMVFGPMTIGTDYGTPSLGLAPPPTGGAPQGAAYSGADFSRVPIPQTMLPPAPNVESQAQSTAAPTGFGGTEIPGVPSLTSNSQGAPGNPLEKMFPQGWQNLGDNYASLFGG